MRQESYFQLERDSRAITNLIARNPTTGELYEGVAEFFFSFVSREGILPATRARITPAEAGYLFSCFREWAVMVSLPLVHWSSAWAMIPAVLKKHGISEDAPIILAENYQVT